MSDRARMIADILKRSQFRISTEAALQLSIAEVLDNAAIPAKREVRLSPRDRPDFVCDEIVIEAKARYGKKKIYKQLERYSEHDSVEAIILVTGTALGMPAEINGKPIFVVSVGMGMLGC